jgi:D-alanine--poly(phosphoribitol) ligase subunit 2
MIEANHMTHSEGTHAADLSRLMERVQAVFTGPLNVEVPSVDTDLLESGLLDSLALVSLLLRIEQEFGVSVSLEDMDIDHWRSIRAISTFLATTLSSSHRA